MKIFSVQQAREMEEQAYHEGASEETFMEQAGAGIASEVDQYLKNHHLERNVFLLCAKGNNSGDAYVAGRYLVQGGCQVQALQSVPIESCSPLCKKNYQRYLEAGGRIASSLNDLPKRGLILDGLFGTGFKGSLKEPFAEIVRIANASSLPILAIDIPSGLNGETGLAEGEVIKAKETIFLGVPKTGFFLNDGWNYVGELKFVDFGLPKKFIENTSSNLMMLTKEFVKSLIPPIKRNWHKYERGFVTGLAGSPDMPGAAILASWAALTSGAGIVRLIHQVGMNAELSAAPLELVRQTYSAQNLEPVIEVMNKATASFIGPGMGRTTEAFSVLKYLLSHLSKPCVIDADALTMLSEKETPLPPSAVLTPHHGEMLRLLGKDKQTFTTELLLQQASDFAKKKKITLVLKGAPTYILQEGHPIYVNPRGTPGMATAGSGDVLTGIIAAFLAQRLQPIHAAILGVYLHALAGEIAAIEKTDHCMIASDLIQNFPKAFKEIILKNIQNLEI